MNQNTVGFALVGLVLYSATVNTVHSLCRTRYLTITADNRMSLYIDGIEITRLIHAHTWNVADTVQLPCSARVIAVRATNIGGKEEAGILGSTDDGFVLTNSSWKCTYMSEDGWQGADFDDSSWPAAAEVPVHQNRPRHLLTNIRRDARWIWSSYHPRVESVAFCRLNLGCPHQPPCEERNLTATVDNIMRIFIDGIEITGLPNADNWFVADNVSLPCTARVIAIQGTDLGVRGGILASTDDGFIITNSSWKCTNVTTTGWEAVGFDDSSWPAAYEVAIHQTYPWTLVPGIRTDAYWIWTQKYLYGEDSDKVVYCRKGLPFNTRCPHQPPCEERNLTATVDNIMRIFIDGIEITGLPNADNWFVADNVSLPCTARVIAIQGTDLGVRGGILASTDDGFIITNSSWKCTNVTTTGWEAVGFDDSSWPAAYEVAIHQTYPWTLVPGIRTDAYWIWTQKYLYGEDSDKVVYCRKDLRFLS